MEIHILADGTNYKLDSLGSLNKELIWSGEASSVGTKIYLDKEITNSKIILIEMNTKDYRDNLFHQSIFIVDFIIKNNGFTISNGFRIFNINMIDLKTFEIIQASTPTSPTSSAHLYGFIKNLYKLN